MSILGSEDHFSRDPVQVQSRESNVCRATEITNERHWSSPGTTAARHGSWLWLWKGWGTRPRKNSEIHIDVSHSRQPLVKGERLVRYEVNTVIAVSISKERTRSAGERPRSLPCFAKRKDDDDDNERSLVCIVILTRRSLGVLLPAVCQARATRKSV